MSAANDEADERKSEPETGEATDERERKRMRVR